jgi:hypothetical protein
MTEFYYALRTMILVAAVLASAFVVFVIWRLKK